MSGGEITGYYNLMSDGGSFEEDGHSPVASATAAVQPADHGELNTTVQNREELTGNGDMRSDPVSKLPFSPKTSILKISGDNSTPNHQKKDGDSISASRGSRVTFTGTILL